MLIQDQIDQRKIEFTLHRSSKRTPNLDDLSQLLHPRGHLQEMGTTFTAKGKMYTYGNPPLNSEPEQMLRLGSMYEEQWNMFFNNGKTEESDSDLWPDLKALKKMLQNEGITFDDQHKRLNYGTSHPKLIQLSDRYDVLREEWLVKTLQDIHPAQRHENRYSPVEMEVPKSPTNLGWRFLLDDGGDGEDELVWKKSRRASRLTIVVEGQLDAQNGPGPIIQSTMNPLLINTPESHASTHDVTDRANPVTPRLITTMRSHRLIVSAPTLIHGSSPLQAVEAADTLLRNAESKARTISTVSEVNGVSRSVEERRHEHAVVLEFLVEDERLEKERQCANALCTGEKMKAKQKPKKKKGLRKWLRAVLVRRKDDE